MGPIASIIVGVTLLVAGVMKVALRGQWPVEAEAMGAPRWVIPAVPWFEMALGASMAAMVRRDVTGWIAASLFGLFTALIVNNLVHGRRPVCACFGSLRPKPLGTVHIIRNVSLIALSILATLH